MTASGKKLAAHSANNLIGAQATAAKKAAEKAAREGHEAGASIDTLAGVDLLDGDGATGGIASKHGSPQHSPVQARAPPADDPMLRFADVIRLTGLSRTTIWRRVCAGTFPAPLSLGENSCGWKSSWVNGWINAQPLVAYAPAAESSDA